MLRQFHWDSFWQSVREAFLSLLFYLTYELCSFVLTGENLVPKPSHEVEASFGATEESGRVGRPRMTTVKGGGHANTRTRGHGSTWERGHVGRRTHGHVGAW